MMTYRINKFIILREESFGGKCFDQRNGNIIEVDGELFALLQKIKALEVFPINVEEIDEETNRCIQELLKLGILERLPYGIIKEEHLKDIDNYESSKSYIKNYTVPETIHYAVTFRCNSHCEDCYMRKHENLYSEEMSLEEVRKVLADIKETGVFTLAIGGGEPFQKENLGEILEIAHDLGFVIHITTGRYDLTDYELNLVKKYVNVLQIGLHVDESGLQKELSTLESLTRKLKEESITFGANFILNKTGIKNFTNVLKEISRLGFYSVTLIRYKPPLSIKRWLDEVPTYEDWVEFENVLKNIELKTDISVRFDCALSFLNRKEKKIAKEYGYYGCTAGSLMLSLAPDGSLFPCSQLVGSEFLIGSLKEEKLDYLLSSSEVINRFRNFRESPSYKESICGKCKFSRHCGSCRALANDGYNDGIMCYDPVFQSDTNPLYENYLETSDVIGCTSNGYPLLTYEEYVDGLMNVYPERLVKNENNK